MTPTTVVFSKAEAYSHFSMECSIEENSMPIAYVSVRDIKDNGFGLE
jgi:hypothetical protein